MKTIRYNGKTLVCHKIKGTKASLRCAPKHKKSVKHTGKRSSHKAKHGAQMRMAKKRAAKMPGGRGPVRKRPAGRKILKR
jgi:hypothetical protein